MYGLSSVPQGAAHGSQIENNRRTLAHLKGNQMTIDSVQKDAVVSMEYTLQVDGEEIDSSKGQEPLQFLVGHGNIISGLEREMMGMKVGDSKKVVVSPAEGYGEFDE